MSIFFLEFYFIGSFWQMVWKHYMQYLWVCHYVDKVQKEHEKAAYSK